MKRFLLLSYFALFVSCESTSVRDGAENHEQQSSEVATLERKKELLQEFQNTRPCNRLSAALKLSQEFPDDPEIATWKNAKKNDEFEVLQLIKTISTSCKKVCKYEEYYTEYTELLDDVMTRCATDRIAAEIMKAKPIMKSTHEKLKPPVDVVSHSYDNDGYILRTIATFRNTTNSEIEAFEYAWSCKDAYGRGDIEFYFWQSPLDGDAIKPGETVEVIRDSHKCRDTVSSIILPYSFKPIDGKPRKIK